MWRCTNRKTHFLPPSNSPPEYTYNCCSLRTSCSARIPALILPLKQPAYISIMGRYWHNTEAPPPVRSAQIEEKIPWAGTDTKKAPHPVRSAPIEEISPYYATLDFSRPSLHSGRCLIFSKNTALSTIILASEVYALYWAVFCAGCFNQNNNTYNI